MKKRNILYIVLLAIIIIGLLWAFIAGRMITKNFRRDILNNATERQQITVKGLIVTETKDNEKYWDIFAEEGQYNDTDRVVFLKNVLGNFYKNGEVVMSFKSDQGTLTEKTMKVVLYENSLIVFKNGEYINADKVIWQGKEEDITAIGNITIEKKDNIRIHCNKAFLTPSWSNFRVKGNVKTELFGGEGKKL